MKHDWKWWVGVIGIILVILCILCTAIRTGQIVYLLLVEHNYYWVTAAWVAAIAGLVVVHVVGKFLDD